MTIAAMLEGVTRHVYGMDLHPVAVTLARVTYLLAMGKRRLRGKRGAIQVPVFLGDSMQWTQKAPTLFSDREITIVADDKREIVPATFKFPKSVLRDPELFDSLVQRLATLAMSRKRSKSGSVRPPIAEFRRLAIPEAAQPTITATFEAMCRLHDEGRDHLWGCYIRDLARPEWLSRPENRVDVIVGNPPWLSCRFTPGRMRKIFRELREVRRLWRGAKVATQQDLSALFVTRMVQMYLKPEGSFALVMPNAVVDRDQFGGFRAGNFDEPGRELRVVFSTPWDLRRLRPHFFPRGAAVVFGRRSGQAGKMPAQAQRWTGRLPGVNAAWSVVEPQIQRELC